MRCGRLEHPNPILGRGGFDNYAAAMLVAEFAFYARALSDPERQIVERDMAMRYGITVA